MFKLNTGSKAMRMAKWLVVLAAAFGTVMALTAFSPASGGNGVEKKIVRELGVAEFDINGDCNDVVPKRIRGNEQVPELTIKFAGGLEGCLYTYVDVDSAGCSQRADGLYNYYEEGNEFFVGTYSDDGAVDGRYGTIKTKYWFEATFATMDDCMNLTNQIDGGCVHSFIRGSGTGVFKRARGQYNVIDNIVDGVAVDLPYILDMTIRQ